MGKRVPIWTASYVIDDYGTGAVMGVPVHDERDLGFASEHGIQTGEPVVNYESGKVTTAAGEVSIDYFKHKLLENKEQIRLQYNYKLRNWLFSRQRYWGEPFPFVYDENGKLYPLDESELPLELPESIDFKPELNVTDPRTPLSRCRDWIQVEGQILNGKVITKNCKGPTQKFVRESNTMPNWAGSCWYYLRYMDPHNTEELVGKRAFEEWCAGKYSTVDLYIGGAEHAVLHLLYARFWHMFLFDTEAVPNPEPFQRLIHQGMITADAFVDANNQYVDVKDVIVEWTNGTKKAKRKSTGAELTIVYGKMGKSYKNGVVPEEIAQKYGIDVFRMYLMYMGPITQDREWNVDGIVGMERFHRKVLDMSGKLSDASSDQVKKNLHLTIKQVTAQYSDLSFHTVIASLIKFLNSADTLGKPDFETFLVLLSPIAPHLCEYLYHRLGNTSSIFNLDWPKFDPNIIVEESAHVPVMQNGRLRFVLDLKCDASDEEVANRVKERSAQAIQRIVRRDGKVVTVMLA